MELRVKVNRVCYPPEGTEHDGNVWCIIDTDKGTCKGKICWRPTAGEQLKLDGKRTTYQGRSEFQFTAAMQDVPVTARDQLRYVAERTDGIGPKMEEEIWLTWGEDWMSDVASGVIPRLSGKNYDQFRMGIDAFVLERDKSESIAWLMGKGATILLAQTAWEEWKKTAITVVNTNCYALADLPNFGFQTVDASMRFEFGITDQDPRRIKAATVYAMKQLTDQGSTIVTWNELNHKCTEILKGVYTELVSACVREMFESGVLRAFSETSSIALGRDYENEMAIWDFVNRGDSND